MIEQKEIEIDGKEFILKSFSPKIGRKIITQYPISAVPKIGDYETNEEIMMLIMQHVGVKTNAGVIIWLKTSELIDNHVPNWEILMKLEYAAMEFNCSFLADGKLSNTLSGMLESLPAWITKMLIQLSDSLSVREKPLSKKSKNITA